MRSPRPKTDPGRLGARSWHDGQHAPAEERILAVCERELAGLGYECVALEFRGGRPKSRGLVRLYIDQPGGVTVDDCVRASRHLDVVLDVEEVVQGPYTLEVSSPGLDRPLAKIADFVRFAGQLAQLTAREPIDGRRNWTGKLSGVEDGHLLLSVDGRDARIPLDNIKNAHLKYQFEEGSSRSIEA